jgi:hypothetical protein
MANSGKGWFHAQDRTTRWSAGVSSLSRDGCMSGRMRAGLFFHYILQRKQARPAGRRMG